VSLTLDPASVRSQGEAVGNVTLSGAAPAGGATVVLESSNRDIVKVPGFVIVPAGARNATFVATTATIRLPVVATIEASYGGVRRQATLAVGPPDITANFTVTSESRAADNCVIVDVGVTQLDCLFNGSGSTGFVTRWRWTLRNGDKSLSWTSSEATTRPPYDCGVFSGGTLSNDSVSLTAELVVTTSEGGQSAVTSRTIRLFPGGRCGY
jgi:hypothetical protein